MDLIKKLWIPQLIFTNDLQQASIEFDHSSSLTVRRMGKPKLSSDTDIFEDYIFEGAENQLLYNDTYSLDLYCDFKLENYPFDFQICLIKVNLEFMICSLVTYFY